MVRKSSESSLVNSFHHISPLFHASNPPPCFFDRPVVREPPCELVLLLADLSLAGLSLNPAFPAFPALLKPLHRLDN